MRARRESAPRARRGARRAQRHRRRAPRRPAAPERRGSATWRARHGDAPGRVADARAGRRARRCRRRSSAGPVREHLLHEMVKSQLRVAARRHGRHQDAALRPRRRQEAVEAEGHGPRPRGQHRARRCGRGGAVDLRPAAARLRATGCRARARQAALRAALAARHGEGKLSSSTRSRCAEPKTKRMVECLAGLGLEGSALVVLGAPRRRRAARGAQPAAREGDPRGRPQRLRRARARAPRRDARAALEQLGARRGCGRGGRRHERHRRRPGPGHHREGHAGERAGQPGRLPRAPARQQGRDPPGRRDAVQGEGREGADAAGSSGRCAGSAGTWAGVRTGRRPT